MVPETASIRRQNEKWMKEPDELLKTSHLKRDTMPDADEFMKNKDLSFEMDRFPLSITYHA